MHQIYAALLGQVALFPTNYCMEHAVRSKMSTIAHKQAKETLQGSCKIKFKILAYKPEVQKTYLTCVYETHKNSLAGHVLIYHNLSHCNIC